MPDRLDLPVRWRRQIEALLAEHVPKAEVWAYGSRVNGTSHDASDLDLVLRGPNLERIPTDQLSDLAEAIEESNIPILIDIHDWYRIPEHFKLNIRDAFEVLVGSKSKSSSVASNTSRNLGDVAHIVMGQSPPGETVTTFGETPLLNGPTDFGPSHPIPTQYTSAGSRFAEMGDLLFCVRGSTTGRMNWADQRYAIGRGVASLRHQRDQAIQPLIRTVVSLALPGLLAEATRSTFPNVSRDQIAKIPWPRLNPAREQEAAHIVRSIDDRIELCRRMCETFEAMTQALFESWFVDFDPVRAKMEGRDTGLPDHIADIFPDRLADSPLGPIPEGWQIRQIHEIAELVTGRSYRSSDLAESRTALVTLKSFQRGGGYRDEGLKPYVGRYHLDQIIEAGEVVIACTDVSQAGDVIGRSAVVRESRQFDTKVASLDVMIVRPKERSIPRWFIHRLLSTRTFIAYASAYATGTTVLHLDKSSVPRYSFICPTQQLIDRVDPLSSSIDQDVRNLYQQAEGIAELRDALLPWLMNNDSLASI